MHGKTQAFSLVCEAVAFLILSVDLAIWYRPFPSTILENRALQLIAFSDAGFGSLEKMCSLESGLIIIGVPVSRNGPVECDGHPIWWVGRKLRRIARSSLACEAAALAMVADSVIWYRAVLVELWFGRFDYTPFSCTRQTPLVTPFLPPDPVDSSLKNNLFALTQHTTHASTGRIYHNATFVQLPCFLCSSSPSILVEKLVSDYVQFTSTTNEDCQVFILLLTDCSNAYQACQQMQYRCECRMTKIHLSFLRDLMNILNLSYVTGSYNIADTGTKLKNNAALFYRLSLSNRFTIAFLSRREYKRLHSSSADKPLGSLFISARNP